METIEIRPETARDIAAVHKINTSAFAGEGEAGLVDALRASGSPLISLVAVVGAEVVGHVLFSPMTDADGNPLPVAALAPMAVLPAFHNRGIGSGLVRAGLEQCRAAGYTAVVVLGHPRYYPRFGFVPASRFGISSAYEVPDEVFMAQELEPGALDQIQGVVRYHPLFDRVG